MSATDLEVAVGLEDLAAVWTRVGSFVTVADLHVSLHAAFRHDLLVAVAAQVALAALVVHHLVRPATVVNLHVGACSYKRKSTCETAQTATHSFQFDSYRIVCVQPRFINICVECSVVYKHDLRKSGSCKQLPRSGVD